MRRLDPTTLIDQYADHHRRIDDASRARLHLACECWNLGRKLERRADDLPPDRLAVALLHTAVRLLDTSMEILESAGMFETTAGG